MPDEQGNYHFANGCVIARASNVPGKWVAYWPKGIPLRGDNDERSYFDSLDEIMAIFIDAGY